MPPSVHEEAVDFLLLYLARTGPNPEYRQAQGFLDRIEAERIERQAAEKQAVDPSPKTKA